MAQLTASRLPTAAPAANRCFSGVSPRHLVALPVSQRRGRAEHTSAGAGPKEAALQTKTADEIQFRPFDEVKEELQAVEEAHMASPGIENSFSRVFYHRESEFGVNEQINIEYNMSYVYHAMSSYFNRDNVALPGIARYFREASLEERTHAQELMDFQARRGGRVMLAHITTPLMEYSHAEKSDALHAMELALSLEKLNFQKLQELHDIAEKHNDAQMSDFVEDMLSEQATGVKVVADYVAQLRRVGKGLGVFQFDRELARSARDLATPAAYPTDYPGPTN